MVTWFQEIPWVVAAAGCFCFLISISVLRNPRPGMEMMMDLWVAAGLLRLSHNLGWEALASSAALIASRKLIIWSWKRKFRFALSPSRKA